MKTKTLVLLLFLAVISITNAHAQNGVIKSYDHVTFHTMYLECTGDWIAGTLWAENLYTKNNWITIFKKAELKGYTNENCTIESGNVYEFSQVATGLNNFVSIAIFSLNGKIVATIHYNIHYHTNANGDVVADFDNTWSQCK